METVIGHENLNLPTETVATIGTFDGVHLGHQAVIEATIDAARQAGLPSLLLTFDVHPRKILAPTEPVEALTNLDHKLELLGQFDLDIVCVLNFSSISKLTATDFYEGILLEKSRVSHLFIGENFRFGAGAKGDPQWLRRKAAGTMDITIYPLKHSGDTIISSTAIRSFLRTGEVSKIEPLLGRNITLDGRVVRGAGRGVGLGFPTANLEFDPTACTPARGVYISYLRVGSDRLPAVVNCGNRPTFGGEAFSCEAHVLDYEQELYGRNVRLELTERLRDERKFPSPEALSRQIMDDVARAREWFSRVES